MGLLPPNLRPDLDALRVDVAVAALRDAVKDGWSVLGLSTGMVDAFTDQTGIASLGGATYDGAAKVVSNQGGSVQISTAGKTVIGNMTGNAGLAAGFDGVTSQAEAQCPAVASTTAYLGVDWGVGVVKTVTRFRLYGTSNSGFWNNNGVIRTIKLQGSQDASTWVDLCTATQADTVAFVKDVTGGITTTTAYRYHRVEVTGGSVGTAFAELQFFEIAAPSAVTVVSSPFALGFQLAQARVVMPVELGGGAIGTDCLLDLSRDGATWAAVPLSDLGKFDASTRIVGGLVSLAGQPAGSSIYWRYRTTSAYTLKSHGIWLQCK